MGTMNIKDPEVHEMAKALAARRHTTVTGAVRSALREALERDTSERTGVGARLLELGARSRHLPEPLLRDDDLYDDAGLPR